MLRLGIFISGQGRNLKAIYNAIKSGCLDAQINLVISSSENAQGYKWAKENGLNAIVLKRSNFTSRDEFVKAMLELLSKSRVDLIVLAGYIKKVPEEVVKIYRFRIINIHPALLPYFGGKGFYGMNVHRAVLQSKAKYSGVSIHFVDENYDKGQIIIQIPVPIITEDTPESLADRVSNIEHQLYQKIISLFTADNLFSNLTK